jgi:DNA-binding NarL/FixJ family response regulator
MAAKAKTIPTNRIKSQVLLVDDHPLVRRGVAELINGEHDMEVCGDTANMHDALRLVEETHPDLVIVDISLVGNSGMELMKSLAERVTPQAFIVYSMHDEAIYAERSLRAGAKGYVMKSSTPEAFLSAVRQVLMGKTYLSKNMSDRLLQKFVGVGKAADPSVSPVDKLSNRELEVLQLLGKGHSTSQVAELLRLSVKTVETYREHVKQKLNLASGSELLRYAIEWSLNNSEQSGVLKPAVSGS